MPYKRTYARKASKTYKKGSKRAPTNKTLAKRVKHIENDLIELKHFDYEFGPSVITPSGITLEGHLLITQGDTVTSRTGNKISPTSLQLRGGVFTDSACLNPVKVRMIAFWDRQCNGASPVLFNVNNGLLDNSVIGTSVYAPRNTNTLDRYTIVYDKVMQFNPQAWQSYTTAAPDSAVEFAMPIEKHLSKIYKLSRQIRYDTNTGTISDLVSNAFYVSFMSDQTTHSPLLEGAIRMYFRDA